MNEVYSPGQSVSEMLSGYSEVMLDAIGQLEELRQRKQRQGATHCGVVFSTEDAAIAPNLKAAMQGVFDWYNSPLVEGVVPELTYTETVKKWWYGVDLVWR